jgi:undecaprenyl-diphosphatase
MAAASGLDLLKSNFSFTSSEWLLLSIGFISAFLTALLAVRFFLRYIKKHSFIAFGWYRIIIGIAILLWII